MNKFSKILLCTVCTIFFVGISYGQKPKRYTVYSTIGDVYVVVGGSKTAVKPCRQLQGQDVILIPTEAAIHLIDETDSKLYSIATPGQTSVAQMVATHASSSKSLTKQYLSYLVKKLFSHDSQKLSHPNCYMQSAGTSYRSGREDSIFLSSVVGKSPEPSGEFEQQVCRPSMLKPSDMDVSFTIISCATGLPINDAATCNESCFLRVRNNTDRPLYVNVLNIDEKGVKYLLLPVDEATTCAHLLVPGQSEVSFKSEPFIFSSTPEKDTFVLLAVESPVDFSILMNPIRVGHAESARTMPLGIYRKFYTIKLERQ